MDVSIIFAVFIGIASNLSQYPVTSTYPEVRFVNHEFFVENACFGKEPCRVQAWYADTNIIYFLNKFNKSIDDMSNPEKSIVLHEYVHYLQDIHGDFTSDNCEDQVKREMEAYDIQNRYLLTIGPVYIMPKFFRACKDRNL